MKRYYLSDLVTTVDPITQETTIEPAALEHGLNCAVVYPPQNPDGSYVSNTCLVLVEAPNQGALIADSRNDALPEFLLDSRMTSMGNAAKALMSDVLTARGLPVVWTEGDRTFRDVIRSVGQALQPNFHEDSFFVSN